MATGLFIDTRPVVPCAGVDIVHGAKDTITPMVDTIKRTGYKDTFFYI
jgi:hypothetical protein